MVSVRELSLSVRSSEPISRMFSHSSGRLVLMDRSSTFTRCSSGSGSSSASSSPNHWDSVLY